MLVMCFYKVKRRIVHTYLPEINIWQKSRTEMLLLFHALTENLVVHPIVSFATRPMRVGEEEGREHYFITPEEAKKRLETEQILAYTKIGVTGYEYFTTLEGLKGANFYVIDPNGVNYIKEHAPNLFCRVIYISVPEKIRTERARCRSDFESSFCKRNDDENAQFEAFENAGKWDLHINNVDLEDSLEQFLEFFIKDYSPDTMYLIVGRTGSGKDTIVQAVKNMLAE